MWQNPRVFRENAVEPHTPLKVLDSKEECLEALKGDYVSKWSQKLVDKENPTTSPFKLFARPRDVPRNPSDIKFDREIPVPMNWQFVEELNIAPWYTNLIYPWYRGLLSSIRVLSYHVPNRRNATGVYSFDLNVDEEWMRSLASNERHAFVTIHGVSSAVKVYVDDQYVGYAQDSMTEGKFTPKVGINLL